MELLIPGLILVALMVYASTRIKKTTAKAFEAESIDTEIFSLEKPEGFLSVINGDPKLEFEAYSKVFGDEGAENIKQARVEIRHFENTNLDEAASLIKKTSNVRSNLTEVIAEKKYRLFEVARIEKAIGMIELYKLAGRGSSVLELKIIALEQTDPDIAAKIDSLVSSFVVK